MGNLNDMFKHIEKINKCADSIFNIRVRFVVECINEAKKYGITRSDLVSLLTMDDEDVNEIIDYANECDFVFPDV